MFLFQNARRDKAVREGRVEYDHMATALEDLSDWKNPAFRYITVSSPLLYYSVFRAEGMTAVNFPCLSLNLQLYSYLYQQHFTNTFLKRHTMS